MLLFCPHCREALNVPEHDAGKVVACPFCQLAFQTPGTTGLSVPPPQAIAPRVEQELPVITAHRRKFEYTPRSRQPQSGCGVASFVIGFFSFIWFAVAVISFVRSVEERNLPLFSAFFIFAISVFAMLGLALGLAGLCQPQRQQSLAVMGIVMNLIPAGFVVWVLMR